MTEEKEKEICKKCKFRELKIFERKPLHWCRQAGEFITFLPKCPL